MVKQIEFLLLAVSEESTIELPTVFVKIELKESLINIFMNRFYSATAFSSYYSFSDTVKEELVRRLYEEIQKLPERRRQIMLLSIDGKSGKEIAEMLNISSVW